ncbi:MAG TPA: DUF1016 N-terminal domain-containing protein [Coriobacteriia bacterium]|jgi:hypothetical protein
MCCSRRFDLPDDELLRDIGRRIDAARVRVAAQIDSELVMLHWSIGDRLREAVSREKRAERRDRVATELADKLAAKYGRGYGRANVLTMLRFAESHPDRETVVTLSRRLSWSHIVCLFAIEDELEREFYTLMASRQRWGVRALRAQVDCGLYRRTIATDRPLNFLDTELAEIRRSDVTTPDLALRDPYVLDFLGLHAEAERRVEEASPPSGTLTDDASL